MISLSALHNKEFEALYANTIQTFNKILQTQVFQALYTSQFAPGVLTFGFFFFDLDVQLSNIYHPIVKLEYWLKIGISQSVP